MPAFDPFEVTTVHIIYTFLGGFIVLFGMFSLFLREKLYIGEACWAFVFGIIIGPYGANIFDPRGWGGGDKAVVNVITLEFTRVVLAIGVFAIGVELPKAYMKRHWKSLFYLLGPIMTWGWFVSAAFIYLLVPGLNFLSSLAVAACLTPTDPILAAAVIGGKYADKHVPAHIRHLLAAESGCNDGAAFPFLFIALYLIIDTPNVGSAIRDWFLLLWLYQVLLGTVIGAALGFGFRYLIKFCERRDLIDRHSYVAQYLSLAMLTIGVNTLLGADDLLAAFACGTAFAWDGFFNRQTEESVFSSVIDLLFNIAAFIFVGAWMPFKSFQDVELTLSVWRLVVIAILVLLFRRLPVMIVLYRWIPDIKTFREALFSGHFGPIGIGAIFISTLAAEILHRASHHHELNAQTQLLEDSIQPIVSFMVLCSILIHGLSIPSFSLGRRVRTVSRTWSRHTSLPDWTNQTQLVRAGADIVINRDPLHRLERGESGTIHDEKVATRENSVVKGTDSATLSVEDIEKRAVKQGDIPEPDGTDTIMEWEEGRHRIIERRTGPGEEVEVEVISTYANDVSISEVFRGTRHHAQEQLSAYMDKARAILGHQSHNHQGKRDASEVEDEDGWLSDGSADQASDGPRRNKVPPRLGSVPGPSRRTRRRSSVRRGTAGSSQQMRSVVSSSDGDRGRSISLDPPSVSSSTPRFPPSSLAIREAVKGSRIDSVRALSSPSSRSPSPSRSIRFAGFDTTRPGTPSASGTSTPRWVAHHDTESGDNDSVRGRVTFEVTPSGGSSSGSSAVKK